MKATSGFTVVELFVIFVFLAVTGTVFFDLYSSVQMTHRDRDRKTAINTIYYNLEEIVKPKLGGYPRTLSASQLTAMDKNLLKDPSGVTVGQPSSDYRYQPTGCNGGDICQSFTLKAHLERESDFVKIPAKS